jgi:hypothetical protein
LMRARLPREPRRWQPMSARGFSDGVPAPLRDRIANPVDDGHGNVRSVGPHVRVSFDDRDWADADFSERDEHRAALIAAYIELVGGGASRRDIAVALWLPEAKGTFDRALHVGLDRGWIVRAVRGRYALGPNAADRS